MNCFLYTCLQNLTIRRLVTTREACEFFKLQKTATSINKKRSDLLYIQQKKILPFLAKTAFTSSLFETFLLQFILNATIIVSVEKSCPIIVPLFIN